MRERNYGTVKKTVRGWQKQMWFSRDEKHQLSLRRMCPQPNPPNNLLEQARTRLCTLLIKCEYCLWMISVMQKLSVIECERIMFMFLLYMSECKAYRSLHYVCYVTVFLFSIGFTYLFQTCLRWSTAGILGCVGKCYYTFQKDYRFFLRLFFVIVAFDSGDLTGKQGKMHSQKVQVRLEPRQWHFNHMS